MSVVCGDKKEKVLGWVHWLAFWLIQEKLRVKNYSTAYVFLKMVIKSVVLK